MRRMPLPMCLHRELRKRSL